MVILTDDLQAIAQELVRGDYLARAHIGLDYFDASINRVAAWVIGTRAMLKALLLALLEPTAKLRELRTRRRLHRPAGAARRSEDAAFGAVWDYYCLQQERARRPRLARRGAHVRARSAKQAILIATNWHRSCSLAACGRRAAPATQA